MTAVAPPPASPPTSTSHAVRLAAWPAALGALVLGLAALLALFGEDALGIVTIWRRSSSFTYGWLVIPIALYLIWERRGRLAQTVPRGSLGAALLVVPAALLWLAGGLLEIAEARHLALVAMLQAMLLACLGPRVYRVLLFPFTYLWLLVPTGEFLIPWLQALISPAVAWALELASLPVYREGTVIEVPSGLYRIAPGCAGLNYLLVTLALTPLYADLMYAGWRKRVLVLVLAAGAAVLLNIVRIWAIIVLAHVTNHRLDIADDHVLFGWGVFAATMAGLMRLGRLFRDPPPLARRPSQATRASVPGLAPASALLAVALAAVAPALLAARPAPVAEMTVLDLPLPTAYGPWRVAADRPADWHPDFPGARATVFQRFARGGDRVDVFVAYFVGQTEGAEVAGSGNRLARERGWSSQSLGQVAILLDGAGASAQAVRLYRRGRDRHVWQWYWVDGVWTDSRIEVRMRQAWARLAGRAAPAAAVLVSAEGEDGPTLLADFLRSAQPLGEVLTAARGQ